MEILLQDLRFAIRQLWNGRGYSLIAIFSLALSIAATVAMFSVLYRVLLSPFPYADADRIVLFHVREKIEDVRTPAIDREQIQQLRVAHSIQDVIEMDEQYLSDTTLDIPQDTDVVFLSGNAFPFFGVPAMLGRTFLPSDAPSGQAPEPVAVLTYQYWQNRFHRDPAIIGQTLRLDNHSYIILGVMPRGFTWWDADVYVPLDTSNASIHSFMTALRIKPSSTKAAANAEIQPIFQQMVREHPHSILQGATVDLVRINERFAQSLGKTLYLLFAAVLLLLLIGCINVSILLLARGAARQHEFAVRAAVGASGARIIRQLLTESLILGFTGATMGVILTYSAITPFAAAMLPWQLFPNGLDIPVQLPVLAFCVALAIFTSVLCGLFPAWQLAKPDIRGILQANSRRSPGNVAGNRFHAVLVASQIALAMILLTSASSAVESFRGLLQVDLGYDPNHIADFSIPVHTGSYSSWGARANYFRQLRDHVAQTPGVLSVSLGMIGPPYSDWDFPVQTLGRDSSGTQKANVNLVDSEFFRTLRIPLLRGRLWEQSEVNRGAGLAIVNEAFVKQYFRNGDVLGHSARVPDLSNRPPATFAAAGSDGWMSIIGVVDDARNDGLDRPVKPEIYLPYSCYMIDFEQIFVRTQADPKTIETAVRRQIARIDPVQQVSFPVVSMMERIEQQSEWARGHLIAVLSTVFSVISLILTSVGLFSVASYSTSQRINEFGVRIALGAQRRHIIQNVLAAAGVSVCSGLVAGLFLSFCLHNMLSHWLGNSIYNPWMVPAVLLLFVIVALLACIVPAVRAATIQPITALRLE